MEKVESRFFPPALQVSVTVIRYPLPSPAGPYPATVQGLPEVVGHGDGGEGLLQKIGASLRLGGKALPPCFPQAPATARAGRGKGSSLPPPTPASSPAQPHFWRVLGWLRATSTPLSRMVRPRPATPCRRPKNSNSPKTNHSPGRYLSRLEKKASLPTFPFHAEAAVGLKICPVH